MRFFIVVAAIVAVANCAPMSSLNTLLGGKHALIPAHLDTVQAKSGDASAILGQLRALISDSDSFNTIYTNYRNIHNKEESDRDTIFAANLMDIAEHNIQYHAGEKSWFKGVNQFSDLTSEEFLQRFTGLTVPKEPTLQTPTLQSSAVMSGDDSDSKDYRQDGIMTPIKNQGGCGSCVTFATNAVVEAAMITKRRSSKPDLSEQELVDCTTDNNGCNGGWYDASLKYIEKTGVASESTYPYTGEDGQCKLKRNKNLARALKKSILKWTNAQPGGDEDSLKSIVSSQGPAAVAVEANSAFQSYSGGIFDEECGQSINHAVVVAGYGNDGQDFWLIRNSWDTTWGEEGYMRLIRNGNNRCNVAGYAYTAKV